VARAEGRLLDKKRDDKVRFDQLTKWYLSLAETKAKKSFDRDSRSIDKLGAFFKTRPISQIAPSLIAEYQSSRLTEKSYRGGDTKPATINREIACLKTMFNKAIRDGKIEKNPMRGVKLLKENNERDRVLSPEEWDRYKSHCPPWYLPLAISAYRTAMRKGEILNLSVSRVDLKEGFIRLRPEDTKTGYGRSIPIHPELAEVLKNALKVRHLNCDFVFHQDGRPYTPHDIRVAHESTCKEAGIDGFVFHDFRHTCINNWRKEGHDYFKIMAVSGHKTISVFKRYNMVDEAELRSLIFSLDTSVDTKGNLDKQKEVSANV
jgi:integrase